MRLRYELTVIPSRPALFIAILSLPMTLAYYAADPVASLVVGLSPLGLALRATAEWFATALLLVLVYHTLRQMRSVSRIHDRAARVDLFQPGPLYAFSRLTSRTGIALIAITGTSLLVSLPTVEMTSWVTLYLPWLIGIVAVSAAAFVVPLMGMHRRIGAEKAALLSEVGSRLSATIASLHRCVDQGDLPRAEATSRMLASLVAERDVINRVSTWPWQPGTVGAFATAIVLPIGVFLATRLLGRVV